ncbi:MAG TPA: hypothetical protein VH518_21610 [Tepidisphaeraceae bacterium]|jgi:hypothetical protein
MAFLRDTEFARRDEGAVQCRPDPLRINWTFVDLSSADSHNLNVRFACSARIADTDADRRMFAEVFLDSRSSATVDVIREHFARALSASLGTLSSRCSAADVVAGAAEQRQNWITALTKAANPVAFACGLELLPPFQLDVESPSLQRQKLEEMARARAEQRTAGQLQHLQHAGELLKQFQQMRQSSPELTAGKLLEQMNPADRGLALQTLLLASSSESTGTSLWAVAGPHLVKVDPRTSPPSIELIDLPTSLGPLRSVQPASLEGRRMLLAGARSGVIVASPDGSTDPVLYSYPGLDSQLGFNRVVCSSTHIWASHSEAGIIGWRIGETSAPQTVTADRLTVPRSQVNTLSSGSLIGSHESITAGPRHLQLLDDTRLIYAVAHELVIREGAARTTLPADSKSEIIAVLPSARSIIAVHQDGTLVVVDRVSRQVADVRHRGSRLSTAGAVPWLGDIRLLLANDQGPIDCLGLDDPLVTEYLSPYRGLKIVTATSDLVAGVSPDRQRVIIWHTWDGQRPVGEIHISNQAKHRVADIEFEN